MIDLFFIVFLTVLSAAVAVGGLLTLKAMIEILRITMARIDLLWEERVLDTKMNVLKQTGFKIQYSEIVSDASWLQKPLPDLMPPAILSSTNTVMLTLASIFYLPNVLVVSTMFMGVGAMGFWAAVMVKSAVKGHVDNNIIGLP